MIIERSDTREPRQPTRLDDYSDEHVAVGQLWREHEYTGRVAAVMVVRGDGSMVTYKPADS